MISAPVAGDIARSLLAEGCTLPSVQKLGRCFRARDFDDLCHQEVPFLQQVETYSFCIPVEDPDAVGLKEFQQQMVLPHELFATLHDHYPEFFGRTFAVDDLSSWWEHQDPSRRANHPLWEDGAAATTIPLQVYGDNVSVCRTVSCLVMLWRSCCSFKLPALESLLPVSSTPLKGTDRASLERIFAVLVWSLGVMATGVWPATDH